MFQYKIIIIFCILTDKLTKGGLTPCLSDDYCPEDSKCVDGICDCNHSCDQNTILVNQIGYDCDQSEHCSIANSLCLGKKCACRYGYIASNDNRECLKAVELGDNCLETIQCTIKTPQSECQRNKCVCPEHMHEFKKSCYRKIELGGYCRLNEECWHIDLSQCTNSRCSCYENYTPNWNNSKCLKLANSIDSFCEDHQQCRQILGYNSHCFLGSCKCQELYQFNFERNKCTRDRLLGERCGSHDECHQPGRGASRLDCILGECKCKSQYREIDGYCVSTSTQLKIAIYTILINFFLLFFL